MRKLKLAILACTASFGIGMLGGYLYDTPSIDISKVENPKITPAPVVEVVSQPLPEVYPWADVDGYLLDCDKERKSERIALACNIYHEARGESDKGQVAVALVTRNRVLSKRYPDTYAEVVWQRSQFSWSRDGRSDKIRDNDAWHKAWLIAGDVISGRVKDFTNGAMYYHTKAVKPKWRKKFVVSMVIGDHIFYVRP